MNADSTEYRIVWLVRRLFRSMARQADAALSDLGITAADRAVMEFVHTGGELSVPEIAVRYDVSRQHVQATVNRLLDAGLVVTSPNPRHKRSALIKLSRAGERLFRRVQKRDRALLDTMFEGVPKRDRSVTHRTLCQLYEALREGDSDE